ncbi:MAG: hypothetical protein IJ501_03600 [Bacilli bacterium]|nr:hypothetical protein [Bacilli bacterium]
MNNINISLEDEIKNSEFKDDLKQEALQILNDIASGDSDDKIKNKIQDDIYELIAKQNISEGEEQ